MRKGSVLLLCCIILPGSLAQYPDKMTRPEYFATYGKLAVEEMQRSGVPASITLAQGALESGDGNSSLAREANNHFGIKCHEDWNGRKIYKDDDSRNECFRHYRSVEDSYRDHSDYLKAKSRYAFLFDLKMTDYKGWAKGLKKAGYATSPGYAESLIHIIEEFGLDRYDSMTGHEPSGHSPVHRHKTAPVEAFTETNRVKYILASEGDTYESLTLGLGKLAWELPSYNDASDHDSLTPGQKVYIQPKRNKATAGKNSHTVKPGETMHSISQLYAVKLDRLYSLNRLAPGTEPAAGTVLNLRKAVKGNPPAGETREKVSGGEEEDDIKIDLNLD